MLIHPVRTKLIQTLGFRPFRCRPLSLGSNPVSFNLSRFMSSQDKGAVPVKKKKESEMTFSPLNPPDIFLQRRQKKFYEQFASKEGKTNRSSNMIIGAFVAILVITLAPIVWYRNKLVKFYEHPETRPVIKPPKSLMEKVESLQISNQYYLSKSTLELVNQVMDKMELSQNHKEKVVCFTADSFDAMYYGGVTFFGGVYLGLPYYTEYTSVDQMYTEDVRHKPCYSLVKNQLTLSEIEETSENSEDFARLKATFVLSENAKKFLIAQKLIASNSFFLFVADAFFLPLSAFVFGVAIAQINQKLNMFSRPFHIRIATYVVYYTSAFAASFLLLAGQNSESDDFVDRRAYSFGREYLEGAVEFYTKQVERGQLFRKLHPKGKFYFDQDGDVIKYFWQPVSLEGSRSVTRLEKAKKFLENYESLEFGNSMADKLKLLEI